MKKLFMLLLLLLAIGITIASVTPAKLYNDSGIFGLIFKGTSTQLADVPDAVWDVTEGDLWYDTTNDMLKTYSGTTWDTGTAAGRGPSPLIWDTCPANDYAVGNGGLIFYDDLLDGVDVVTNKAAAVAVATGLTGNFGAYTGTTANTLVTLTTYSGGATVISTDTDNESAMLNWPKCVSTSGQVKFTTGKKFWFECRLQVSTIADSIGQLFIGFAEETLNSAGALLLINEAGMADKDYIGFIREYADGDALNTEFNTDGGTAVSTGNAITLVAATYVKLGIYCDGSAVTYYADGVALGGATTTATTDFPDGEEMAFYLENMCGAAGTVGTVTFDWIRIAQEY